MQGGEEEVTRAITGEHATCSIRPMCPGSKPDKKYPGSRIAESRYGTGPVVPIRVGTTTSTTDSCTILTQDRTFGAGDGVCFKSCQ